MYSSREVVDPDMTNGNQSVENMKSDSLQILFFITNCVYN